MLFVQQFELIFLYFPPLSLSLVLLFAKSQTTKRLALPCGLQAMEPAGICNVSCGDKRVSQMSQGLFILEMIWLLKNCPEFCPE